MGTARKPAARPASSATGIEIQGEYVLGVGVDSVGLPGFSEQFQLPGSTLSEPGAVFTARELRRAGRRALAMGDATATHLAGVWALKEAALKAWLGALARQGTPPPLDRDAVNWSQIEIAHTADGAPRVALTGAMLQSFVESVRDAADAQWHASASHDGGTATAFVVLTWRPRG